MRWIPGKLMECLMMTVMKSSTNSIKMQPLCLTCIKNNSDDWEDDVICNLTRNDQTNEKEFKCGAYEKL